VSCLISLHGLPFVHFVCSILFIKKCSKCPHSGLLEQICDEKSRPRGCGPSSQPAEQVTSSGGLFSSTFSSWGKKLNSALDVGKAKVIFARFSCQGGNLKTQIDKFVRHVESLEAKSMQSSDYISSNATRAPVSRPPLAADHSRALSMSESELSLSEVSKEDIETERLDREEALRVRHFQQVP
jgi:hypothetical protein